MDALSFWPKLEKKAQDLGFSEIAATPITDLQKESEEFESWLQEGNAADMDYMVRTKEVRKDPKLFLANAQSVIVGAVGYYQPYSSDITSEGRDEKLRITNYELQKEQNIAEKGKIARYATGRDYHKVMKKMLLQLIEFLRTEFFPNTSDQDFRISLDVHPVLERAWAVKSELGFAGKNACLITEKAGSWVLIGGVFTTQRIPKKQEIESGSQGVNFSKLSCGTCTRCIDYCPTKAIVAPGKIDARKCISYLTIENKGGIPLEFRDAIGDRLFGCDICQEVCPFNIPRQSSQQGAEAPCSPLLETEIAGTEILIEEILKIETDEGFLERFAGSPLMRAKRRGLLRNACVVAGNSQSKTFVSLLESIIKREKDDMLQEHAQWAIDKIKGKKLQSSVPE